LTATTKVAFALFPLVSVAEHLTVVRPRLKRLPERGVQLARTKPSSASFPATA
jgi:hypothetical protein